MKTKPLLLIFPALLLLSIFAIYPVFQAFYLSLFDKGLLKPTSSFVGLRNYATLFADRLFWNSLKVSLLYVGSCVAIQFFLGLFLATLLNSPKLRGRNAFRVIFIVPYVISGLVIGLVWAWLFNYDFGLLNAAIKALGFRRQNWLLDMALPSVTIAYSWWTASFSMVLLESAMKGIPEELYDAAKIDGANRWQSFRFITLPSLRYIALLNLIIITLFTFNDFSIILLVTAGGPLHATDVLGMFMWRTAFQYYDLGYGSTIAAVYFIINIVIALAYIRGFGLETLRGEV
jgi:ABC-type sugar transport system permease subunit